MLIQKRGFSDLDDLRLVYRGNKILDDLFSKSVHSIRQVCGSEAEAKGCYRFLRNDRVTEDDIVANLAATCTHACRGKYVVCVQDTSEVNLISHQGRIRKDGFLGPTNASTQSGLGFLLHPCLVLDAQRGLPYGYADIKLWNRPLDGGNRHERQYKQLPIEQKESYRWVEVSKNTRSTLSEVVAGMVIVQDREGDIYEQFCEVPDAKTDLLIRAKADRRLAGGKKLFCCFDGQQSQGSSVVSVPAKKGRKKRTAHLDIRFTEVTLLRPATASKEAAPTLRLCFIEAKEGGYTGEDAILWRLLTTLAVETVDMARLCIEWYTWRWMIEEVFKILKKEGFDIEASELESASAIRKLCLLIREVTIKLFLMRIAYAEPEENIGADACFTQEEQCFLEEQGKHLEGKTQKQKNPYQTKDLKRYVWVIAKLGGWKGYESKRHPGITTLWIGLKYFKAAFQGWLIHRNVSTR